MNSFSPQRHEGRKERVFGGCGIHYSSKVHTIEELERLATTLVDAAFTVHSSLGPGLLESAYQACLVHELRRRGLSVEREVALPVHYAGLAIDAGYRLDMILDDAIIIENKSVRSISPLHISQVLTYLKLADRRLGFLINWNVPRIKDGIRRLVNKL